MDKLIIIAGPTAVGKSAAAVELAKKIDGEIVSADSMQVYRNMDIGTAKISKKEMKGIPHHLLDILDPEEEFNVSVFQKLANDAIKDINARSKIPVLTGGRQTNHTGMNWKRSQKQKMVDAYSLND